MMISQQQMAEQMTDSEKMRCQQWLNEYYGPQLEASKRNKTIMEAKGKIEQEQDYDFDSETTER